MKSARRACTRATSWTEHTTPPHPLSIAFCKRASNALVSVSLVSTVTAIGTGRGESRVARAFVQSFDRGAQHVGAARRVEVHVRRAVPAEHAGGAADCGGDVVQLEVGEHGHVEGAQPPDRIRTSGGEQFEANLGDADPRRDFLDDLLRTVEIGNVERNCETVAYFGVGHVIPPVSSRTWVTS